MKQLPTGTTVDLSKQQGNTPPRLNVANPFGSEIHVEVVIVNYRRPRNIPKIIEGFRAQTEPCRITICDVGRGADRVPCEVRSTADAVIDFSDNAGGFNRYVAVNAFRLPFTWFHDDDMVPGKRMVEGFLRYSSTVYGILGHIGRIVRRSDFLEVIADQCPVVVDFLVRGYWVRSQDLPMIQRFLWKAWEAGHDPGVREDDILLAKSIEAFSGRRAIVVPPLPEGRMNDRELPEPHAQSHERSHIPRRLEFVKVANSIMQAMQNEPRRIVLVGGASPERRNLVSHLRTVGLELWLRTRFAGFEVLTIDEGEEAWLPPLKLSDRDLVVGLSARAVSFLAPNDPVPSIVISPGGGRFESGAEMPDMALFLDQEFAPPDYERDGILVAVDDPGDPWQAWLATELLDLGLPLEKVIKVDAELPVKTSLRTWLFRRKVAEFASVRAVLTDNPDYLALALLARTPCLLIERATEGAPSCLPPWLPAVSAVRIVKDPRFVSAELEAAMKGAFRELPDFRRIISDALEQVLREKGLILSSPTHEPVMPSHHTNGGPGLVSKK